MDDYLHLPLRTKPQGLRIIVCGGRDYCDRDKVFAALDRAHAGGRIGVIVHGAAPGADLLAQEWAEKRGVEHEPHPANWNEFGRRAGPLRNHQMASLGADGCIAFPGGTGTADMIGQAKGRGIPVWRPYG